MSDDWSGKRLALVRSIWGIAAGSVFMGAAIYFVPHLIEDGVLSRDELLLTTLFAVIGVLAASPTTAFQLIGKAVEVWNARKKTP
jgi:uncharacterized membrane protein YccC